MTIALSSETTVNWKADDDDERWTVPIIAKVSRMPEFGPFPFNVEAGIGIHVAKPSDGPDWKLRTAFVILLPRKAG